MHVEQHHVGLAPEHGRHRLLHRPRVSDDLERVAELGPDAAREQLVVLDDEDADHGRAPGMRRRNSGPRPGSLWMAATPPVRSMRPSIDSAIPWRSGGTLERENPTPWSRTNAVTWSSSTST